MPWMPSGRAGGRPSRGPAERTQPAAAPPTTNTAMTVPTPTPAGGWVRRANATAASLSSAAQASHSASASEALASLSSLVASASSAITSESSVASGQKPNPSSFKVVGILLAVLSGVFIGASFVIKKKGLLRSQAKHNTTPGEGVKYLTSALWWTGMVVMIVGEACNLVAYSFAEPLAVTPMGALSVVISAMLSHFVLKETLTLFGWLGCALCVLGAAIIGLNGGDSGSSGDIRAFEKLFVAPGFLAWLGICAVVAIALAVFAMPRWGKKYMLIPICICSTIGGLSVTMTSGVGASIVLSIRGQNQVTYWFFWLLVVLTAVTLVVEILYLNKALEVHETAMVTATYYVLFTSMSLVSTIVLNKGMNAGVSQIVSLVLAFLVTCIGITVLQMSKINPTDLEKEPGLDRKSTMLLKASHSYIRPSGSTRRRQSEKEAEIQEEPGVEAVMPGLGMGVVGSILRARSSRRSRRSHTRQGEVTSSAVGRPAVFGSAEEYYALDPQGGVSEREQEPVAPLAPGQTRSETLPTNPEDGTRKYRLYDGPVAAFSPSSKGIPLGLRSPQPERHATTISWVLPSSPPGSSGPTPQRENTADSALARISETWSAGYEAEPASHLSSQQDRVVKDEDEESQFLKYEDPYDTQSIYSVYRQSPPPDNAEAAVGHRYGSGQYNDPFASDPLTSSAAVHDVHEGHRITAAMAAPHQVSIRSIQPEGGYASPDPEPNSGSATPVAHLRPLPNP